MGNHIQPQIFNTVAKKNIFNLYNNNKIDYQAVADKMNFNRQEVAKAVRIDLSSVKYEETKIPDEMKVFFQAMILLLNTTHQYLQDENKVIQWLDAPNTSCGGYSPKDMIRMGQYKKLVNIVSSYAEGKVP